MKKTFVSLMFVLALGNSFAQDLTSKKGEPILPESGDWAIGINTNPFFGYLKSIGSSSGTNSPSFDFLGTQTITGKYFITDKKAYRIGVRLGFGSQKQNGIVDNDVSVNPRDFMTDTRKITYKGIGLSFGKEIRRGKTRLQGYYGGETGFSVNGTNTSYNYGNPYTSTNTNASYWDFIQNKEVKGQKRDVEIKSGNTFSIGVRGFVGVEYFILPKMSIGGEFGWGLTYTTKSEGHVVTEFWDNTQVTPGINTTEVRTGRTSNFSADTDNNNAIFGPAGTLRLNLHF